MFIRITAYLLADPLSGLLHQGLRAIHASAATDWSESYRVDFIFRLYHWSPAPFHGALIRHLLASHRKQQLSAQKAAQELGLSRTGFYNLYCQYLVPVLKARRRSGHPACLATTISPNGPVQSSLHMVKGKGMRVTVAVSGATVVIKNSGETGGFRVSPGGEIELRKDARSILDQGTRRHYWIELHDERQEITLHPFK